MPLSAYRITGYQDSFAALPDRVAGQAERMKALFDSRTDGEIPLALNGLVDVLCGAAGAGEVGAAPGSVQDGLQAVKAAMDARVAREAGGDMVRALYDPDGHVKGQGGILACLAQAAPRVFSLARAPEEGDVEAAGVPVKVGDVWLAAIGEGETGCFVCVGRLGNTAQWAEMT